MWSACLAALQAQEAEYARGARCDRSFDVAFRWERYAQRTGRAPGPRALPSLWGPRNPRDKSAMERGGKVSNYGIIQA